MGQKKPNIFQDVPFFWTTLISQSGWEKGTALTIVRNDPVNDVN